MSSFSFAELNLLGFLTDFLESMIAVIRNKISKTNKSDNIIINRLSIKLKHFGDYLSIIILGKWEKLHSFQNRNSEQGKGVFKNLGEAVN